MFSSSGHMLPGARRRDLVPASGADDEAQHGSDSMQRAAPYPNGNWADPRLRDLEECAKSEHIQSCSH